ncbi:MAG TPA: mannonate dehydratase [Phycisphaerae bacterium]|nr:mannonate dehydratase [Phycisphaerae bacterium]
MKLGILLPAKPDIKWQIASQAGVKYVVTKAAPELTGQLPPWDFDSLKQTQKRFNEAGFELQALEGDEFDMSRIKLGLPGRDEDIEKYQEMLRNMGRLKIPLLCYNFMAGVGWYRSRTDLKERGGALTSGFFSEDMKEESLKITHEQLWSNYEYFIRSVAPVAEESGVKLGLHPDDPPVSSLCGYPRILTNAAAFRRAIELADSPVAGITFCAATFKVMGENVANLLDEFRHRIWFIHMRDNQPMQGGFRETFHDNGPTDIPSMFELIKKLDINCLLRPDHAPTMAGENNDEPGYAILGRLFAVGYLKGIMDTLKIG